MTYRIIQADCVDAMREMDENSVDAIVTDPPYGIRFMGKAWDGAEIEAQARRRAGQKQPPTKYGTERINPRLSRAEAAGTYDFSLKSNHVFQGWCESWATEALRVLKPGGHLLAFGGTRTYHRLVCAIEDAGFEIRDTLAWLYGSGFPKSLDVSKAIDKAAGEQGEYGEPKSEAHAGWIKRGRMRGDEGHEGYQRPWMEDEEATSRNARQYLPATEAAQRWQGWGTALKPGWEGITLARKPLSEKTVAANVQRWGTGGLNIDGTRIGTGEQVASHHGTKSGVVGFTKGGSGGYAPGDAGEHNTQTLGRWPANAVFDEEAARLLDEQSGERRPAGVYERGPVAETGATFGNLGREEQTTAMYADAGGASRFFFKVQDDGKPPVPDLAMGGGDAISRAAPPAPEIRDAATRFRYVPKADRAEREIGLEDFPVTEREVPALQAPGREDYGARSDRGKQVRVSRNNHPTVKPIALMAWLCRMVTPPGGTVLDPFAGSGSTGIAALREGFEFIGIEKEPEYVEIARARIQGDAPLLNVEAT